MAASSQSPTVWYSLPLWAVSSNGGCYQIHTHVKTITFCSNSNTVPRSSFGLHNPPPHRRSPWFSVRLGSCSQLHASPALFHALNMEQPPHCFTSPVICMIKAIHNLSRLPTAHLRLQSPPYPVSPPLRPAPRLSACTAAPRCLPLPARWPAGSRNSTRRSDSIRRLPCCAPVGEGAERDHDSATDRLATPFTRASRNDSL